VLPDGTSFETSCEAGALAACVSAVVRALEARRATADEVGELRARLSAARRRAAADAAREAETLALAALLGESAGGLAPFGRADDDDAVTPQSVSSFLGSHYGPSRAMLVAAGEVRPEALADAASSALEQSPDARARRADRGLRAGGAPASRVAVGEASVVAVAIATVDLGRAAAIAEGIAGSDVGARLESAEPRVHAFEVRGGALVLAHVAHDDIERAAAELAVAAGTASEERSGARPIALDDDAVEAARAIGLRWIAGADGANVTRDGASGPHGESPEGSAERDGASGSGGPGFAEGDDALALGLVIAGGRGDGDEGDPDRGAREDAARNAERALAAARVAARPVTRGEASRAAASVVTPNGARIDVRRRGGDARAAVAIRFAGGAGSDPPSVHGRAALLAVLVAEACPALGPGGAAERASAIDATIAPRVDGQSWGLVVETPAARWHEALDLATRCALAVTPSRTDVERARILLLDRLDGGAALAAWAARSLAHDAPGGVAPLGGLDAVRETSVASVRRAWRDGTTGARISIAIVGDVPVQEAVARAARRVARLESGTAVGRPPEVEPAHPDGPLAEDYTGPSPRVVVTWRAGTPRSAGAGANAGAAGERAARARANVRAMDADAARVFADAMATRLGSVRGLRAVWADGGVDGHGAWAAVAFDTSEAALADLPSRIAEAAGASDDTSLRGAHAARVRARARSEARPAEAADAIARRRLTAAPRPSPGPTWAALRAAPPGYVIGRPRVPE
jgi:hypothetical protein